MPLSALSTVLFVIGSQTHAMDNAAGPAALHTAPGSLSAVALDELSAEPTPPAPPLIMPARPVEVQPPAAQSPAPAITAPAATPTTTKMPTPVADVTSSDIIVTGRKNPPNDPLEAVNVQSYKAVQVVDRNFTAPLANGYKRAVPSVVRRGLHNFLSNLGEPVIAANFLLQIHPGRAFKTLARFGLNTTIGIGGFLDVAKTRTFKLPFHPNGFADTLGYYGVKSGPYFYLPLIGSTTLRDFIGTNIDGFGLPTLIGKPFNKIYYTVPANAIRALDYRINYDTQLRAISESINPYVAAREAYLRARREEIAELHSHRHDKHDAASPSVPSAEHESPAPLTPPAPSSSTVPEHELVPPPASPPASAPVDH